MQIIQLSLRDSLLSSFLFTIILYYSIWGEDLSSIYLQRRTETVTVHSVLSNAAKIHSRLPAAMGFWLVCLRILAYSCQNTSRDSRTRNILVIGIQPCSTLSKMSANGSMAFFTSWTVLVWAPASRRRERGRRWRL